MAQALTRGIIASGKFAPENIMASAPKQADHEKFLKQIDSKKVLTTTDNSEIAQKNDVVFLAVRPPLIRQVVSEIAPSINRDKLIVSIALGVTIGTIESLLPTKARVVRVIPNTPAVVQAGASAYSMGSSCLEGDNSVVHDILTTVGYAVEVDESLVDPITGLASCGPSYMYCAVEALADGGVKMGLSREMSINLAAHALLGAAKMILETGKHPAELKDDVQSPAGSSIYGMHNLERSAFRGTLMDAVEAATLRSMETGEKKGQTQKNFQKNPFNEFTLK